MAWFMGQCAIGEQAGSQRGAGKLLAVRAEAGTNTNHAGFST